MSPEQELVLVTRVKSGDREALGQLWDALTPKLFGYLINTLRDRSLAEDLLQTTWLKAVQALPRFQPRGAGLSAWLFAIARNECKQHWRKANREVAFEDLKHDKAGEDHDTENKILVDQILNLLSEDDRELLRLRYIADLPLKDIATMLNINSVAVRVRMHRALARARTAITSKNHEY